jgi:hypothetical protein
MTEGKTGSQRRSLRRHHDQRKKAWVRKNLTHYFYGLAVMPADRVGRYARTPKVCSCFMYGNLEIDVHRNSKKYLTGFIIDPRDFIIQGN